MFELIAQVDCPLLETMASDVATLTVTVARIEDKLNHLLEMADDALHIEFTIGPVSEQE